MRKVLTFAVAALLATGITVSPASAATPAAGGKCTVKLATAKAGSVKLYCGTNTNAKTKAKFKLAWKKSVDCYDLIRAYNEAAPIYALGLQQSIDAKAALAKIDTKTISPAEYTMFQSQITAADAYLAAYGPTISTMKSTMTLGCK